MKLKCYIIKYSIKTNAIGGVAVVIAPSLRQAEYLLKTQGKYNGTPNEYNILTTHLINDTNQFNAECVLEEYDSKVVI